MSLLYAYAGFMGRPIANGEYFFAADKRQTRQQTKNVDIRN